MYKQQAPRVAGLQMSHWDRCLTIADEIGSTAATKWATLWSDEWRKTTIGSGARVRGRRL
jgi:hypothetical protein